MYPIRGDTAAAVAPKIYTNLLFLEKKKKESYLFFYRDETHDDIPST